MFNSNASSADAGGANYIEDVFSTWLYTGTGATQTITNGIDLAGEGGLVWDKIREVGSHQLHDTVRGINYSLYSDSTSEQDLRSDFSSLNANGFTLTAGANINVSGSTYASWTFRKQPKFFDVVTYTGNGASNREIAHNLGSTPGCIMVKRTDASGNWHVYHVSLPADSGAPLLDTSLLLNSTSAALDYRTFANSTFQTDTIFKLGNANIADINASGGTYVAYLFAHDAGGFGLTGTDNVISCGSFTTDGDGNASVNLGYEPQFWLYKPVGTGGWTIYDTMRGWSQTSIFNLNPNTSGAEGGGSTTAFYPTATGFDCVGSNLNPSATFIYIAIRRGPMKVPTTGTSVYTASTQGNAGDSKTPAYRTTFPVDFAMRKSKTSTSESWQQGARLTGTDELKSNSTAAIVTNSQFTWDYNNGWYDSTATSTEYQGWMFQRAPGFFDVVCYTGTGSATTVAHNLAVVPELMIVKRRNTSASWWVYAAPLGATKYLQLNTDAAEDVASTVWNDTAPTASVFTLGTLSQVNNSGNTFVNYLFATCPGVSKVGSYTGNGTSQAIACGFTGGARFVLIKRTDSTGDWYVYDTARGMTVLTDPYLLLNSTAAETATLGSVITSTGGFTVNAAILAAINTNAASYVFLAIA